MLVIYILHFPSPEHLLGLSKIFSGCKGKGCIEISGLCIHRMVKLPAVPNCKHEESAIIHFKFIGISGECRPGGSSVTPAKNLNILTIFSFQLTINH